MDMWHPIWQKKKKNDIGENMKTSKQNDQVAGTFLQRKVKEKKFVKLWTILSQITSSTWWSDEWIDRID